MKIVLAMLISVCPFAFSGASAQTFHGYVCTDDCSGHEAGYQWAEDQGVTSTDDCTGSSNSFIEGCTAYVEENEPTENETPFDE